MSDLESIIADLVRRKNAVPRDSAERRLLERELTGLRYSYEDAGPLIESLDPYWGSDCRPLPRIAKAEGLVLPLRRAG